MENYTDKLLICICSYNRPDFLIPLFDNLKNQNNTDFTVILLNDGKNSKTKDIFQTANFPFSYHYLETEKPSGLPRARNIILDYIKNNRVDKDTTYIAFLDDDLIIKNDFVEMIKKYSSKYDGFCFRMDQRGISTTFDLTKSPLLQKIFSPIIGKFIPFLGIIFGGFYIKTKKIKKVDHLVGCCLIYNFSKNNDQKFDPNLNEGNYVAEDTCFSYGLKKAGNDLRYIGNYSFIHNSPNSGGCKIDNKKDRFFWYWKHKLYLVNKFHGKVVFFSAALSSFLESIALSMLFKTNLVREYWKAKNNFNLLMSKNEK